MWLLIAAFVLQALLLFVVLPGMTRVVANRYSVAFQDLYDMIAENLVLGNGYRVEADTSDTMLREPGYPLLLAAAFRIGGYHIETARLVNLVLTMLAALALMTLALHLTGDRSAALLAALIFMLYPGTLMAVARAGVEISYLCGLVLFLLLFHQALAKGQLWRFAACGLILGVTVMIRSEAMFFPFLALAFLLLLEKGIRPRLMAILRVGVVVVAMVAVMVPWIVRNYRLSGEFVPTATVAGVAAQEGLYTCENLSVGRPFWAVQLAAGRERGAAAARMGLAFVGRDYYQFFYRPQDEVVFNKALLQQAKAEYQSHPLLLPTCASKNLLFNFWFLGKTWQATALNAALQIPILALALCGVVALWKRGELKRNGIVLAFILYVPLLHAPIIAHARHSIIVIPFLAIPASLFLASWWRVRWGRKLAGAAVSK